MSLRLSNFEPVQLHSFHRQKWNQCGLLVKPVDLDLHCFPKKKDLSVFSWTGDIIKKSYLLGYFPVISLYCSIFLLYQSCDHVISSPCNTEVSHVVSSWAKRPCKINL